MKRAGFIVGLGLLAVCVFALCYLAGTRQHRSFRAQPGGELAWLAHEFRLAPAQTRRIAELHAAYQPRCDAMCRRIEENTRRLDARISAPAGNEAEIAALLRESAQIQVECRTEMLAYIRAVAALMPPEQAARYLAVMKRHVLLPGLPHTVSGMPRHEH